MYLTHIPVPTEKLLPWLQAVRSSAAALECQIQHWDALHEAKPESFPVTTEYFHHQLRDLQDLEMFLSMSWNQYMDSLALPQAKEVSHV